MAALQAKRAVDRADVLRSAPEATVAEVFQLLATLLLLQIDIDFGNDLDSAVKENLIPLLRTLVAKPEFQGKLGSEAPERVLCALSDDNHEQ
jgi:hypothetical protein